jgi:ATP-dependent DNA helicase RecG
MRGGRAVRVVVADGTEGGAALEAWWFYAAHGVLSTAKPGTSCILLGRVQAKHGKAPRIAHPDILVEPVANLGVRSRYPSFGVAPGLVRRAVADSLGRCGSLPDPVPAAVAAREAMPDAEPLLRAVHGETDGDLVAARRALGNRLAWVEAFALVWQRKRGELAWGDARAPVLGALEPRVERALLSALGFDLTGAQKRAVAQIAADLASPAPMRRLLLGDVGTGKTAVALVAAAQCVASGQQCALLAPTSLLAEQYGTSAAPLEKALGARRVSVVSAMRAADRKRALDAIARGEADVVVGTHALLEEDVKFARLGLVVVDEQQRFGVAQRLSLVRKGREVSGSGASSKPGDGARPHLLSLSATPIPRTLALALRGELAVTTLDERPRGRPPVATELVPRRALPGVIARLREVCARGERAFFVCPRIEDDEGEGDEGVLAQAARLQEELAGARVVAMHGAMRAEARAEAMAAFRSGVAQLLVGTTVVEVGLDVPEATLMVVDGAERFGLAQLHQLRGRVGRGERPGRCLLLHDEPLVDLARQRLETLAKTSDGAEIARADLALRGGGDLGGVRQSGEFEEFQWLDPAQPPPWIERIDDDVRAILGRDPELRAPEHVALALALRRVVSAIAVREEAG